MVQRQIREIDVEKIKVEANRHFFLIMGRRTDENLVALIPEAENVVVIDGVCSVCREPGSFDSADGKCVLCRGCKILEKERIAIMDVRIQEANRRLVSQFILFLINF